MGTAWIGLAFTSARGFGHVGLARAVALCSGSAVCGGFGVRLWCAAGFATWLAFLQFVLPPHPFPVRITLIVVGIIAVFRDRIVLIAAAPQPSSPNEHGTNVA